MLEKDTPSVDAVVAIGGRVVIGGAVVIVEISVVIGGAVVVLIDKASVTLIRHPRFRWKAHCPCVHVCVCVCMCVCTRGYNVAKNVGGFKSDGSVKDHHTRIENQHW